jgi:hypothetical protein
MSIDEFDILGVGHREDSYSDFIWTLFNANREFKDGLIDVLALPRSADWRAELRRPVTYNSRKCVFDLILTSKTQSRIAIIENKIFAGEGQGQTEMYAQEGVKAELRREYSLPAAEISYFFLTLRGETAKSRLFENISYSRIIGCVPQDLDGPIGSVARSFVDRIEEVENWSLPADSDLVLDYLNRTHRLVDGARTFALLVQTVRDMELLRVANRGNSEIHGGIVCEPQWKTADDIRESDGLNYNIHFEYQWGVRGNNHYLRLDYEPQPYLTKKQMDLLRQKHPQRVEKYERLRRQFFEAISAELPGVAGKFKNNMKTTILLYIHEFDRSMTVGELRNEVNGTIRSFTPIIESVLRRIT